MSTLRKALARTNGMLEVLHFDETGGLESLHTTTHENIDIMAEQAAEVREKTDWVATKKEPMRHVAKIPQFVLDKSMREGWFNDDAKWRAWANDPDNAIFRTWPLKI